MGPQLINMMIGLWLMAAPSVIGYGRPAATSDHIVGPLVATFACIAIWEATRGLRWVNLPLGIWAAIAPLLLGAPSPGIASGVLCGMLIAWLATRGGAIQHRFDGGWSMLWLNAH